MSDNGEFVFNYQRMGARWLHTEELSNLTDASRESRKEGVVLYQVRM